jgi:hypothetical protein
VSNGRRWWTLDEVMNGPGRSEIDVGNELPDAWMRSRPPFIWPRRRETGGPWRLCGGHFGLGRGGRKTKIDVGGGGGCRPLGERRGRHLVGFQEATRRDGWPGNDGGGCC